MGTVDVAAIRAHLREHGGFGAQLVRERPVAEWVADVADARAAQALLEELDTPERFFLGHALLAEAWLMAREPLRVAATAAVVNFAAQHAAGDLAASALLGLSAHDLTLEPTELHDALIALGPSAVPALSARIGDALRSEALTVVPPLQASAALEALDAQALHTVLEEAMDESDPRAIRAVVACQLERVRGTLRSAAHVEQIAETALTTLKRFSREWLLVGDLLALLAECGAHLERTLPTLLSALNVDRIAGPASDALTKLSHTAGDVGARALHHALYTLRDGNLDAQRAILAALVKVGPAAGDVAPEVALRLWVEPLRREATQALGTLCDAATLPTFLKHSSAPWKDTRVDQALMSAEYQHALEAIVTRLQADALPALGPWLANDHGPVRALIVRSLAKLSDLPWEQVEPLCERAENDPEPLVRVAGQHVRSTLQGPEVL